MGHLPVSRKPDAQQYFISAVLRNHAPWVDLLVFLNPKTAREAPLCLIYCWTPNFFQGWIKLNSVLQSSLQNNYLTRSISSTCGLSNQRRFPHWLTSSMNWPLADPRGRVHPPVTLPYQQRKNEPIFLEQSNSSYLLRSDSGVAISPSILHVFLATVP